MNYLSKWDYRQEILYESLDLWYKLKTSNWETKLSKASLSLKYRKFQSLFGHFHNFIPWEGAPDSEPEPKGGVTQRPRIDLNMTGNKDQWNDS